MLVHAGYELTAKDYRELEALHGAVRGCSSRRRPEGVDRPRLVSRCLSETTEINWSALT